MGRQQANGINLRWHEASQTWRKTIGSVLGKSGRPTDKDWYWRKDEKDTALAEAAELKRRWKALREAGKTLWDEDDAYRAKYMSKKQDAAATQPASPVITLADGAKAYIAHLQRQADHGQTDQSHVTTQTFRVNAALNVNIGSDTKPQTVASLPLTIVDRQRVEAVVLKLASRPQVTRDHWLKTADDKAKAEYEPVYKQMSIVYAKACIKALRWCLDWLAEEGHWTRCQQWDRVFKAQVVLTDDERREQLDGTAAEVDHFTLDELCRLWVAVEGTYDPPFWQTLILLGLNCGFANEECSDLKASEVKLVDDKSDAVVIERYRGKTVKKAGKGAYAKWHLWPETVARLIRNRAPANEAGNWLLTDDGQTLTANNSIGQGWRRLAKRAGIKGTFKWIRKTAAHVIRNELGLGRDLADMLLSHADGGMIAAYAGRDWDGELKQATTKLRQWLERMFNSTAADFPSIKLPVAKACQHPKIFEMMPVGEAIKALKSQQPKQLKRKTA